MKRQFFVVMTSSILGGQLCADEYASLLQSLQLGFDEVAKIVVANAHEEVISEEVKNQASIVWPYEQCRSVLQTARINPSILDQFKQAFNAVLQKIDEIRDYTFRAWWFAQDRFTLFVLFDEFLQDADVRSRDARQVIQSLYGAVIIRGVLARYVIFALNDDGMHLSSYVQHKIPGDNEITEDEDLFNGNKEVAFAMRILNSAFAKDQYPLLQELPEEELFSYQSFAQELALLPTRLDTRSYEEKAAAVKVLKNKIVVFDQQLKSMPDVAPCLKNGATALLFILDTLEEGQYSKPFDQAMLSESSSQNQPSQGLGVQEKVLELRGI